jgi:hypothetical protein
MGQIGLGGVEYQPNPSTFHQLTEPDGSGNLTDLIVYQLIGTPNVPAVSLVTQTPSVGSSLTMVGYGSYAVGSPVNYSVQQSTDGSGNPVWTWTQDSTYHPGDYSGYTYTSGQAKRWGTATVSAFSYQGAQYSLVGSNVYNNVYDTMFPTIYSGGVGVAQAIGGDSGGAVFDSSGNLVGLMEAMSNLPNQPANTVISDPSSSVDLDYQVSVNQASYISDIASYQPQIQAIIAPVPEPTGLAVVAFAGVVVSRRRRAGSAARA